MTLLNKENINLVKIAWGHCERLSNLQLVAANGQKLLTLKLTIKQFLWIRIAVFNRPKRGMDRESQSVRREMENRVGVLQIEK